MCLRFFIFFSSHSWEPVLLSWDFPLEFSIHFVSVFCYTIHSNTFIILQLSSCHFLKLIISPVTAGLLLFSAHKKWHSSSCHHTSSPGDPMFLNHWKNICVKHKKMATHNLLSLSILQAQRIYKDIWKDTERYQQYPHTVRILTLSINTGLYSRNIYTDQWKHHLFILKTTENIFCAEMFQSCYLYNFLVHCWTEFSPLLCVRLFSQHLFLPLSADWNCSECDVLCLHVYIQ